MFLQIFADGTVIDSEGVHHVRPADLKPIVEAVQSGELYRLRGHCGAPSTDFIEYVHIVVYERRLGRLQAHSFSYSGNPQGCDHVDPAPAHRDREPPGEAEPQPAQLGTAAGAAAAEPGVVRRRRSAPAPASPLRAARPSRADRPARAPADATPDGDPADPGRRGR